ncbi:hypothetical protein MMC17_010108 [Xylographa soralifera]|nr:hypothetical protein [Xylographa soralifera]
MALLSLENAVPTALCLLLGYVLCTSVWRLYLSPLARIPGPKLAALTSWYEFYYDVVQPAKFCWKIKELHEQYGSIVRITPREVHIKDVGFLDTIYAPASIKRNKDPHQIRTLRVPLATGGTTDYGLHRKRRAAIDGYFSKRSVVSLEPLIVDKIDKLCKLLDRHIESKEPVNLSDVYFGLAADIVMRYCFKRDDDILASEKRAAELRFNAIQMLTGVKVNAHFPWLIDFMEALPSFIGRKMMPAGVKDLMEHTDKCRAQVEQTIDQLDNQSDKIVKDEKSIFHDLLSSDALPESEKAVPRLEQEGALLIMAGTDSPARSLQTIHYHLLMNPVALSRVYSELRTISATASWPQLETLPFLSACIAEAFRPERWLGKEKELGKYQMAFNKGGRKCVGIELAHAELFLTLGRVLRMYDMELFETGPEDVEFKHDYHVPMPNLGSKGIRVKVSGRKELEK